MTLNIGALTHSGWGALVPVLQALGWNAAGKVQAEQWYLNPGRAPKGSTLLLHCRAEWILARSLEQGQSPDQAIAQWQRQAEAMLAFFKANRRTSRVIDARCLAGNPDALNTLCQSLGIAVPENAQVDGLSEAPPAQYLLIAIQLIRQNGAVEALMAQLEACTLPLAESSLQAPEADLSSVIASLDNQQKTKKALSEASAQLAELKAKHSEQSRVLTQQQSLQSDLTRAKGELEVLSKQHNETRAQLTELQALHNTQTTELTLHQKENHLLLEQLHLVQEELEQQLLRQNEQVKANEEQVEALQAEVERLSSKLTTAEKQVVSEQAQSAHLQTRLKQLNAELSAANTRLERAEQRANATEHKLETAAKELADSKAKLAALSTQHGEQTSNLAEHQQENQMLIEQLHLVQEELEQQLLQKSALSKELEKHSQAQDHALAAANKQISRLQNELNGIKSSTAWKAAAPVRALGRPFRRTPADKRRLKKQAEQIMRSEYFDREWYLATYPDVAENGFDPAEHYLKFGAGEGRNPGARFDTLWYVQAYPDVQDSGINPLIHYLNHGQEEGRAPNPKEQISLPSPTRVN